MRWPLSGSCAWNEGCCEGDEMDPSLDIPVRLTRCRIVTAAFWIGLHGHGAMGVMCHIGSTDTVPPRSAFLDS